MKKILLTLSALIFLFFFFSSNKALALTCAQSGGTCQTGFSCISPNVQVGGTSDCNTSPQYCCALGCGGTTSGYCPTGKTCTYDSQVNTYSCEDNCSSSNPNGYCASGKTCVNGTCNFLCSSSHPSGYCESGTCAYDSSSNIYTCKQNCSNSNPDGYCASGKTCSYLTGAGIYTCQDNCSSSHPNGVCPYPQTCTSGKCVAPPTACNKIDPKAHCSAYAYCNNSGNIPVDGATDCGAGQSCCKPNEHYGQCPVCPPSGANPDLQYHFDNASQPCINDRGTSVDPNSWQKCADGQVCYAGSGCKATGFDTGLLPCGDANGQNSCHTAFGLSISTDPVGIVKSFFGILLSVAGALAVILIIISGYRLTTSRGNPENIQHAREQLTAAVVGLMFVIFSFTILNFIGISFLNLGNQ